MHSEWIALVRQLAKQDLTAGVRLLRRALENGQGYSGLPRCEPSRSVSTRALPRDPTGGEEREFSC